MDYRYYNSFSEALADYHNGKVALPKFVMRPISHENNLMRVRPESASSIAHRLFNR